MKPFVFILKNKKHLENILDVSRSVYSLIENGNDSSKLIYWDSFDYGLLKNNLILVSESDKINLLDLKTNEALESVDFQPAGNSFNPDSLPDSNLKIKIYNFINPRVLINKININFSINNFLILNEDEKIIARMKIFSSAQSKKHIIRMQALRGYQDELKILAESIRKRKNAAEADNFYSAVLKLNKPKPKEYSSKLLLKLKTNELVRDALIRILKELFRVVKINEDGVINDIDIEFLHNYRVAVRKSRSVLTEFKSMFSKKHFMKLKEIYSELSKHTGALRDSDVFLLRRKSLEFIIPDELSEGLIPLFNYIEEQRRNEFSKLQNYLQSEEYLKLILKLKYYFDSNEGRKILFVKNKIKIKELTDKKLKGKYIQIISAGRAIDSNSKDAELHELRISCKKFRYLLEVSKSLYPSELINLFIAHLKKLQEILGSFNDISVQRKKLNSFLSLRKMPAGNDAKLNASIGGIISLLKPLHEDAKNEFFVKFKEFDTKGNYKLVKKLFGPK